MNPARRKIPYLPEPIQGLADIALNLAWSWNATARRMFKRIDPTLWSLTHHDPIQLLHRVEPARLAACAHDPDFLHLYRSVMRSLGALETTADTWFAKAYGDQDARSDRPVAYFCAEFGIHNSVPIYSGGLGILAGDHVKTASDLGIPMVGVGLLYARGYFDQHIDEEGWQVAEDESFEPEAMPLARLRNAEGSETLATVITEGRPVELAVWEMRVGRTRVFLLDTNLEANDAEDRDLTGKLYGTGEELRLRQEWILGVGGVRVLRALGIEPSCWHANEGHAAFMMVERIRERVEMGVAFPDAVSEVRTRSVFTTHTPVPAGHDTFTVEQIERCMGPVWDDLGVDENTFMQLGHAPVSDGGRFHMTACAIRLSRGVNGVSKRHGAESRRMWKELWPGRRAEEVPIGHVTNGVHRPTWMSSGVEHLLDGALGTGWANRMDEPGLWDRVLSLDDAHVWELHQKLKLHSFRFIREQARRRWKNRWPAAGHLAAAGPLLDPEALTLGFARRFATYKRADLLLRVESRLHRLVTNPWRPVQIVFAGKAHPADDDGKRILQKVYMLARDPRFGGRIAFVEDYEMHLAHALYEGVDVWLNVPRVPKEASGTSGMKAALNMVPQLGTLDGWWAEGFSGINGWAIPTAPDLTNPDEDDWDQMFNLLEDEVVPLFHQRDRRGVPVGWVQRMKHALWVAGRQFATDRMLKEYANLYYVPAMTGEGDGGDAPTV
jgi:starch phosphorylase